MFIDIHWFILFVPVIMWLWLYPMPSTRLEIIRAIILVLLVLALAEPVWKRPAVDSYLIMVVDKSLSMPAQTKQRVAEIGNILIRAMPETAKLGIVSFGENAAVEMIPSDRFTGGMNSVVNSGISNLEAGIELALSLIPSDSPGRILVISDGNWTGENPRQASFRANRRSIPVDFRHFSREFSHDVSISSFDGPGIVNPEENIVLTARVNSPVPKEARVLLYGGGKTISSGLVKLRTGNNTMIFRHRASGSEIIEYRLVVEPDKADPVPENNSARTIVEVLGKKPFLIISESETSPILSLIESAGQQARLMNPGEIGWNIEFLAGYCAVVIENVSANRIGFHGMRVLDAWAKHMGGGLLLTGGENSYGPGGYYRSPIEEALPLSLELRSDQRKIPLALMIVLDRSGSMAAPTGGGRTKMDLANMAAAGCMDMLSPLDEFGLLAVDTVAHKVVDLQKLSDPATVRKQIMSVQSQGGGIYVHEGLSTAIEMLLTASARNRHIILFADASDAEQPGRYWELLEKAGKAGITLSVIGLGTEQDSDAGLLMKIAQEGSGRCFFTRDPAELPRLFSQDTFVAARSSLLEEETAVRSRNPMSIFMSQYKPFSSKVGGYNVCYEKPGAHIAMVTADDNKVPLLAFWQYGAGRVGCYTSAVSGELAGDFIGSSESASMFMSLLGWLAFDDRQTINDAMVTQQLDNGRWSLVLHLDPQRERETFAIDPKVGIMRSVVNQQPVYETLAMSWETADSLAVELQLKGSETIVAVIEDDQGRQLRLNPVCLPYSYEYAPVNPAYGYNELKNIAKITSGIELLNLSQAWQGMPTKLQYKSLASILVFMALLLLLVEVAERRTGFLSAVKTIKPALLPPGPAEPGSVKVARAKQALPQQKSAVEPDKPADQPVSEDKGMTDTLRQARKKAGRRISRR